MVGTGRVKPETIEAIHTRLGTFQVRLSPNPHADDLRRLFSVIRAHRNAVARILAHLYRLHGRLRSGLARADRKVEAATAALIAPVGRASWRTGADFMGCVNDTERKARTRVLLSDEIQTRDEHEEDLALVAEALAHGKMVMDELRSAFEEGSRSLAARDLEYRVERSAP